MFLLSAACAAEPTLPTTRLTLGGHTITVEVADDEAERSLGLMHRKTLPADAGMLFVYPDARVRNFWMKNTHIPLTIAYIGKDGRIVHLADMKPLDLDVTPSVLPATYALEMNQGWFAAHGIAVGDAILGLP